MLERSACASGSSRRSSRVIPRNDAAWTEDAGPEELARDRARGGPPRLPPPHLQRARRDPDGRRRDARRALLRSARDLRLSSPRSPTRIRFVTHVLVARLPPPAGDREALRHARSPERRAARPRRRRGHARRGVRAPRRGVRRRADRATRTRSARSAPRFGRREPRYAGTHYRFDDVRRRSLRRAGRRAHLARRADARARCGARWPSPTAGIPSGSSSTS